MKTYTEEEILDKHIGKKGTPKRETFDSKLKAGVLAYRFKQLRKKKQLTEQELNEKIKEYTEEILGM